MSKEDKITISSKPEETSRIEKLIEDFCLTHRIHDEYFGVILRSMDIILNRIITLNEGKEGHITIQQQSDKDKVSYTVETSYHMSVMFNSEADNKETNTLKLLITSLVFMDSNKLVITFTINALHNKEWARRNNLLKSYFKKSTKHA